MIINKKKIFALILMISGKKPILSFFAIQLLLGYVSAQSFFSPIVEDVPFCVSARQMALGFSSWGSRGLSSSLLTNPAIISLGERRFVFNANISGLNIKEKRSFPVQDSFGDFLADNFYVVNKNWFPTSSLGLIYKPFSRLNIAFNFSPFHKFHFDYEEEIRGSVYGQYNRDPLVGYHRISNRGNLYSYSFGGSLEPIKNLILGGAIHIIGSSTIKDKYEIEVIEQSDNLTSDYSVIFGGNVDVETAIAGNLGLMYQLSNHIQFAMAYQTPYIIKYKGGALNFINDSTSTMILPEMFPDSMNLIFESEYQYPQKLRIGFLLRPTNVVPTEVFIEFVYEKWEKFKIDYECAEGFPSGNSYALLFEPFNFKNILKVHLGVEHKFFSGFPFRVGFFFNPSPIDESLNRNWFTFGTGYRWDHLSVDFSGAFMNGDYKYPDLFPIEGEKRIEKDTIREEYLIGKMSVKYIF